MTLRTASKEVLESVYEALKSQLSHKGFNEYFTPLKRLGKGGFATVYLVEHKFTKKKWAGKVFSRAAQKNSQEGYKALENEIRVLRALRHPNILHFEGIYETDNLIYVVTEYLSGGTLDIFTRNRGSSLGQHIVGIIKDTLSALAYLRSKHVMHRDLKPENMILREADGRWVLADFGLAAFTQEDFLFDTCGTMGYIAPEITNENRSPQAYTAACDAYSAGVMIYYLLVGCYPFKVEKDTMFNPKLTWNAFTEECEDLPGPALDLLRGLLESNPEKRLTP